MITALSQSRKRQNIYKNIWTHVNLNGKTLNSIPNICSVPSSCRMIGTILGILHLYMLICALLISPGDFFFDPIGHCMANEQYIGQLKETFATSVPSRIAAFFAEPIQVLCSVMEFWLDLIDCTSSVWYLKNKNLNLLSNFNRNQKSQNRVLCYHNICVHCLLVFSVTACDI